MKQQILFHRFFASLLLLAVSTLSWAYDLEIDGMYYNLNSDEISVSLTYKSTTEFVYTGDVAIPSSVKYRGRNYKVTAIGDDAFAGCEELTSVSIPDEVETIGSYAFAGCEGLTSVTIPSGVKTIKAYAFNICENLSSIVISQNVQTIEDNVFSDCSGLTSVTINSNAILSKYYSEDNNLKNIFGEQVKEYIIGDNVIGIDFNAFRNCSGLTSVTIGNSVTCIGQSAFRGCSALTSVTIPNSVTIIAPSAFSSCSGLTSVTIGNSVTSIGSYAFHYCSGLTSITIPNCVMNIENQTFSGCSGLTSVTIGNGVTSIGDYAFDGCSSLTSVNIPNNVTSIGQSAFYGCSGLASVTIPKNMTSIGNYAFEGCSGLTSVTCLAENVPNTGYNAFKDVPQSTATLYVPEKSVNAYKTADQWKKFGNIVGIDPTAVEELKSDEDALLNENAPIFDLIGRRLQQKPASGYYIQGGKKFFVK